MDQYFVSSGVTRYFLPDLPKWANYSQSADCRRETNVRYFNVEKLRKSFAIDYVQALQLQLMFNVERTKLLNSSGLDALPLKDEEKLFFNVSEKIQSRVYTSRLPDFKRVNLVWIDQFIADKDNKNKLKKLMKSEAMMKGHPVFVSLCLSYSEVEQFLQKIGMGYQNIRIISFEMFSPYNGELLLENRLLINFNNLFFKEQKLYLYLPTKKRPIEFEGNLNVKIF
jgi:hypothetical protein